MSEVEIEKEPVAPESKAKDKEPEVEMVEKAKLKQALDEMHKEREERKKLQEKLKTQELSVMKDKQDWQKIAELKEKEAQHEREEKEALKSNLIYDKKFSAVQTEALKLGIREEALRDLDMLSLDDVVIETTSTGRINVLGAKDFVERLKATRPHWFGGKSSKVNTNSPEVTAGSGVTWEDLTKAEERAKKTGDYAPYKKLLRQYQQSNP